MSELMWCGSVSHVGLTGVGAKGDTARENLISQNDAAQDDMSVGLAASFEESANARSENFMPQSSASVNSAKGRSFIPASRNFISAQSSALVKDSVFEPQNSNFMAQTENFAAENSFVAEQGTDLRSKNSTAQNSTANYTAQSPTCENSAPQSQAYEGSVFDLREDLRAKISKNSRFVRPVLRDKFFYKAAKFISAAMDISDGLAQDLPRLLEASGVGARWIARPSEAALQSGEEYEILFSFAPKFLPKIYAIAAKTGVSINIIAEVCPRTPQSSMEFLGKPHHFAP